ncbi:MAG: GNAT family N-acetyltransferase [Parvularculaceae bacterium]|nr:GNAT family N-acetyltransferase [Parvularculaceae bacterium]
MDSLASAHSYFQVRIARRTDVSAIVALMEAAISENMKPFLSPAEIAAARETMGLDTTLIEDGTYFVVETEVNDEMTLVGCGGWGRRKTLYGGDAMAGRDDSLADPETDAARIRAMYTHPAWTRRGVGSLLLECGEAAARNAGFKSIELGSTIAGEPLYRARGYVVFHREERRGLNDIGKTVIHMRKAL